MTTATRKITQAKNKTNASLILLASLLCIDSAWAVDNVGSITHLSGVLLATRGDGATKILSVKSDIQEGDTLKTGKDTFARIKFIDGAEVVLRPETVFQVNAYKFKPAPESKSEDNVFLSLLKGGLRSVTGLLGKRNPDQLKLKVATATIGVRGTHFGALLCNNDCANIQTVSGNPPENGLHTDTAQGAIVVSNNAGSVVVAAGGYSFTPNADTAPKIVPPTQGIQVTMPPAISENKGSGAGLGTTDSNSCNIN